MRWSAPTPWRTRCTSAPTRSHSAAISFMKEMRMASMVLATYLLSSALAGSIQMMRCRLRHTGW